jgi:hypothetical protein
MAERAAALESWSLETWRGERRAGGAAAGATGERTAALELERRCGRAVQDAGRTAGAKRRLELGLGLGATMGLYSSSGPQLPTGAAAQAASGGDPPLCVSATSASSRQPSLWSTPVSDGFTPGVAQAAASVVAAANLAPSRTLVSSSMPPTPSARALRHPLLPLQLHPYRTTPGYSSVRQQAAASRPATSSASNY